MRRGATRSFPPNIRPEQRALAEALCAVYELLPSEPMRYYSKLLAVDVATLSRYLNGHRRPDRTTIERLHRLAAEHQRSVGMAMPVPLEDIYKLLADAERRGAGVPGPRTESAAHQARPGDWDGADAVSDHLLSGRTQDAYLHLATVGRSGSPADVCSAADTLRRRGHADAAEAVLLTAGQRSDRDRVAILTVLNEERRYGDIAAVLRAAADVLGGAV